MTMSRDGRPAFRGPYRPNCRAALVFDPDGRNGGAVRRMMTL
ncbi:hypothetical protein GGQ63_003494 [Prosthecomicrobium pneumaticum]|uniref:Uncharacterized protein n=1 Tax=Prosthecomicrobium pneumaticum TaxID=81895 RepID=A0A7W9FPC3_9HYPH|nr:hypothetical protein [Prosthecomicrobium pneumaticum]